LGSPVSLTGGKNYILEFTITGTAACSTAGFDFAIESSLNPSSSSGSAPAPQPIPEVDPGTPDDGDEIPEVPDTGSN
jgi:hypothetical protein